MSAHPLYMRAARTITEVAEVDQSGVCAPSVPRMDTAGYWDDSVSQLSSIDQSFLPE